MLQTIDWVIIGIYFLLSAFIGVVFARRAGSSVQEFFLSGRNLPWWLPAPPWSPRPLQPTRRWP